jgi:luciferase family oxidoreductase group 1
MARFKWAGNAIVLSTVGTTSVEKPFTVAMMGEPINRIAVHRYFQDRPESPRITMSKPLSFSVLDLAWIPQGSSPADALNHSRELAQHAERLGYHRYWVAEHHNMSGVASCATAVVLSHIGAATSTIRIGAGGVMLPNHAPLIIAEQFGTLDAFYPGRVDLGLGRAPGTDGFTVRALRRDPQAGAESFPQDVQELQSYFLPAQPGQRIRAVPATGRNVPIWILGSSTYGAQVAAALGLPFAFAANFAPPALTAALEIYRRNFQPSAQLEQPYAAVCVHAVVADSDEHAKYLATTGQQAFYNLHRGQPKLLQPPQRDFEAMCSPDELAAIKHTMKYACVGSPHSVAEQLREFLKLTEADELLFGGPIFDHHERLYSYELVAKVCKELSTH